MKDFEILSPETISKTSPGTPMLTIARKAGPMGFHFRDGKGSKGLLLNHTNLANHILKKNGISAAEKSYKFRILNAVEINLDDHVVNAHPLIKLPSQK